MTSVAVHRIAPFAPPSARPQVLPTGAPQAEPARQRSAPRFAVDPASHGNDPGAVGAVTEPTQHSPQPATDDRLPGHGADTAAQSAAPTRQTDNVIYLHPDDRHRQDPGVSGVALPFAPFVAQQLAQQTDGAAIAAAPTPRHFAAADAAYRAVAGDPAWVLGPARPTSLTI